MNLTSKLRGVIRSRKALLAGLSAGALLGISQALLARPTGSSETTVERGNAPVLSLRRAPEFLVTTIGDTKLRSRLRSAIDAAGGESCLIADRGRRTLLAHRTNVPLVPASGMKLLTGQAVLSELSPTYRYRTEVRTDQEVSGSVLRGPLYLVGDGDPLLATSDYASTLRNQPQPFTSLDTLADRVAATGLKEVDQVIGDEARYDFERYLPSWKPSFRTTGQIGPMSALTVNDGFKQWRPARVPSGAPALDAATVFSDLLRDRGVQVIKGAGTGLTPSSSKSIAAIESASLRDIVGEMIRESDNLTAELLTKELGREKGQSGSTREGLSIIRRALAKENFPIKSSLSTSDGSGLSLLNRSSCALLHATIDERDDVTARLLPIAGRTGTLALRLRNTPAEGRLRAKTGSLSGIVSLTGWIEPVGGGERVSFSFVANELTNDVLGLQMQDSVALALALYPETPPVSEIAPSQKTRVTR